MPTRHSLLSGRRIPQQVPADQLHEKVRLPREIAVLMLVLPRLSLLRSYIAEIYVATVQNLLQIGNAGAGGRLLTGTTAAMIPLLTPV